MDMEQEVHKYISNFISNNGWPPTVREIINGTSAQGMLVTMRTLDSLQKKGLIKRSPGTARGIRVLVDYHEGIWRK